MKKKSLFILLFCSFCLISEAQKGWEIGGWLGVSNYFGDLNTKFDVTRPGPAGGIIARHNFNKRICLRFGANYGSVSANDADSKNSFEQRRNLSFQSHIIEGVALFEFNFLPYEHGDYEEFFTPYVYGGLNVYHFNPRTKYEDRWVALQPLGTEGQFKGEEYALTQLGLAYGVGLKMDINAEWSFNVQFGSRYLFSDYLDDVSTVYPDEDDIESLRGDLAVQLYDRSIPTAEGIKLGQEGRQRGDDSNHDFYTMVGVGIVYYFGKIYCPTFK